LAATASTIGQGVVPAGFPEIIEASRKRRLAATNKDSHNVGHSVAHDVGTYADAAGSLARGLEEDRNVVKRSGEESKD